MLSCGCDYDDGDWYYYKPDDFSVFSSKRRKRCCSCKNLIDIGNQCVKFGRKRGPVSDIEEKICGDEIDMAAWFLCELCGEMYFNLTVLGYCHYLGNDIRDDMKEYWELTGFGK